MVLEFFVSVLALCFVVIVISVVTIVLPCTVYGFMEKRFKNIAVAWTSAILTFLIGIYFLIDTGEGNILEFVYAVLILCATMIAFLSTLFLHFVVYEFMDKKFGNAKVSWTSAILTFLIVIYIDITFYKLLIFLH